VNEVKKKIIIIVIVVLVVAAGSVFGINILVRNSRYVTTDNANLAAPLISVSSLSAGQITGVEANIGDRVEKYQVVAEIGSPRFSDSAAKQGFQATPCSQTTIEAPVSGYVAAVWTYPGAVLAAGSPIVTLFDDSKIWVTANLDENDIKDVRPGQDAEVTIDCLGGAVLKGKVQAISPATASSFSLLPSSNSSANFTKVGQVIPVRISLNDIKGLSLIPGSSVEVKISIK
jgi:multidrug resistance efflux pump